MPQRQPAPRQYASMTICPGDNIPRRQCAPGDNVPRETMCPGRQCAPETMRPGRQCAPGDNVPRQQCAPGDNAPRRECAPEIWLEENMPCKINSLRWSGHMVPHGPVWSCMILYGPIWSCMTLYGAVWTLMTRVHKMWDLGIQDPGSRGRDIKVRKVEKKSLNFSKISTWNHIFLKIMTELRQNLSKCIQRAPIFGLVLLIYVSRYPTIVRKVCI